MNKTVFYPLLILLLTTVGSVWGQIVVKVTNGQIFVNDPMHRPKEKDFQGVTDSLDRNLVQHPNDTTSLFYRALLYVQFNTFVFNPALSTNSNATNKLLQAKKMADKADSLKMQNFGLKVLRAQICKELTNRYAPIETWRLNAQQMADRKKRYDYYKMLANNYYDELARLDKRNAYDYSRMKVK